MIRLTSFKNGSPIYVPADVVIKENYEHEIGINNAMPTAKYKPLGGARVVYDGIEYAVKESQEEVARNVLEWRLAMERYRVALSLENPNLWEAEEKKLKALAGLERKDEVIEEQKRQLFYKSKEITELREKSWQDQQWFKQASANITEMQKELDRIEREHAEERAAHNAHVAELCELEQERNMYKASSEVFYERLKKVDEEREKLIECLRFYERLARGREINDGGRRARTLLAEIGVTVK